MEFHVNDWNSVLLECFLEAKTAKHSFGTENIHMRRNHVDILRDERTGTVT